MWLLKKCRRVVLPSNIAVANNPAKFTKRLIDDMGIRHVERFPCRYGLA